MERSRLSTAVQKTGAVIAIVRAVGETLLHHSQHGSACRSTLIASLAKNRRCTGPRRARAGCFAPIAERQWLSNTTSTPTRFTSTPPASRSRRTFRRSFTPTVRNSCLGSSLPMVFHDTITVPAERHRTTASPHGRATEKKFSSPPFFTGERIKVRGVVEFARNMSARRPPSPRPSIRFAARSRQAGEGEARKGACVLRCSSSAWRRMRDTRSPVSLMLRQAQHEEF